MYYVAAVVASAALTAIVTGLAAAVLLERARRQDLERRVAELEQVLASMERVGRNKLYRESLESKQTQVVQAALRLRVAKRDLEDALAILNLTPPKEGDR